jgi:hypothetical protein
VARATLGAQAADVVATVVLFALRNSTKSLLVSEKFSEFKDF